jgi:hypothetical protein
MIIIGHIKKFAVRWSSFIQVLPYAAALTMPALNWFVGPQQGGFIAFALAGAIYMLVAAFPLIWTHRIKTPSDRLKIYNFQEPARIFLGFFNAPNTDIAHSDQKAAEILRQNMKSVGVRSEDPRPSDHAAAPQSYKGESMILICGPHGNKFSFEVNTVLQQRNHKAFYFQELVDNISRHTVQGGDQWAIMHGSLPELQLTHPKDGRHDYGLIYVGPGPQSDKWLIWVAGIGRQGTVGAARALTMPEIQAEIADRLIKKTDYVSALVYYEFEGAEQGNIKEVIFLA